MRTIRFYDKQNILKPSYVNPSGARFYTDSVFARLQQILLLKYLGFSLDDIREMTINDTDYHFLLNALTLQKQLIQDKIEQMQLVENAIEKTVSAIEQEHQVNWSQMLDLIHLTGMEKTLKSQDVYKRQDCECPRFGTGEAKGKINESVRGMDLFIMCDVTNYSITYKVSGYENHMSPDDHFQDLKRIIAAATGKAHRINVIMPFLYEGRQHKRCV